MWKGENRSDFDQSGSHNGVYL